MRDLVNGKNPPKFKPLTDEGDLIIIDKLARGQLNSIVEGVSRLHREK
jgi:hypothetical protein